MSIFHFYLALLLLVFILIYYGVSYGFAFAPYKIKAISVVGLIVVSLRYVSLIILLITKNINNLYLLKPLVYLNLLCITTLAIITIYILARNDRIKFNYCLILIIALVIFYVTIMIRFPISIEAYGNIGYIMHFNSRVLEYGIYIVINTIFFFVAIILLENKNCSKLGMRLVLISAFAAITELILRAAGFIIFPAYIIGDMLWIGAIDYALYKFKK